MKCVGYYPGCSLRGGGRELSMSLLAVADLAGVELREIDDWNCCGATAAHSLSHNLGVALPFRSLALAEEQGLTEVLAPCSACFSRLKGTNLRLARSPELSAEMARIVRRRYTGTVNLLSVGEFLRRLLADGLAAKLTKPLGGLKVAAYYGCLLARGEGINEGEDPENPTGMEEALKAAGCEVVPWNLSTDCCGGGLSMSLTKAVVELSGAILNDARTSGAEAVVTACPMCHSNLDMRQLNLKAAGQEFTLPVLYLTEIIGLAAGLAPDDLGLDRHFIDAMPLAARSG